MADVRPREFPHARNTKPYRDGERLLHQACAQLPANWYVPYGVPWLAPETQNAREGECDFVFIGPEIGLVVVEVKGRGVSRDHERGWFSVDRTNERHYFRDPAAQAQRARYAILNYLRRRGHDGLVATRCTTHMVCFPQIDKRSLPELPELPSVFIIDSADLFRLDDRLIEASSLFNDSHGKEILSQGGCRVIADALRPSFEAPNRWTQHIWEQRFAIEKLTEEQKRALEMFVANRLIALSGPAGSGKTIAALHQARRAIVKGRRILILVPTRGLKDYYSSVLGRGKATVVLPDQLGDQLLTEWHLVIIDEAQDISQTTVDELTQYCDKTTSSLLVIHDSNQKLERQNVIIPGRFPTVLFNKILRSTSQIGELSARFYFNRDHAPEIVGPAGLPVEELPVQSVDEIPTRVSDFIWRLINTDEFTFRDIVVLFGDSSGKFIREGGRAHGGLKFRDAAKVWCEGCDDPRCIASCNIKAFRGIESPVFILCEVDHLLEQQLIEGCYVGMSRAQHLLAIAGTPGTLDRIRNIELTPIARKRIRHAERTKNRQRGAEKLANLVSPGTQTFGTVTGVEWQGVFVELAGLKCTGLLRREQITSDTSVDLEALFRKGEQLAVVVVSIDEDKGHISLGLRKGDIRWLRRRSR